MVVLSLRLFGNQFVYESERHFVKIPGFGIPITYFVFTVSDFEKSTKLIFRKFSITFFINFISYENMKQAQRCRFFNKRTNSKRYWFVNSPSAETTHKFKKILIRQYPQRRNKNAQIQKDIDQSIPLAQKQERTSSKRYRFVNSHSIETRTYRFKKILICQQPQRRNNAQIQKDTDSSIAIAQNQERTNSKRY